MLSILPCVHILQDAVPKVELYGPVQAFCLDILCCALVGVLFMCYCTRLVLTSYLANTLPATVHMQWLHAKVSGLQHEHKECCH